MPSEEGTHFFESPQTVQWAEFSSNWSDGCIITTPCCVNTKTHEIEEIRTSINAEGSIPSDDAEIESERVTLADGAEYDVVYVDSESDAVDALQDKYWYADGGLDKWCREYYIEHYNEGKN